MEWKFSGTEPVFLQLADALRLQILRGEYASGEQIPTVRQLATEAAVNPNTVQRALVVLEEEGLVYASGTQGRFVTQDAALLSAAAARVRRRTVKRFLERAGAIGLDGAQIIEIIKEEMQGE